MGVPKYVTFFFSNFEGTYPSIFGVYDSNRVINNFYKFSIWKIWKDGLLAVGFDIDFDLDLDLDFGACALSFEI